MQMQNSLGLEPLPINTIANLRGDLKAITTRHGVSYDGPPIPPPASSLSKMVERGTEVTKDMVQPSTKNIQPLMVQTQVPINEPVVAPKLKPTIPYPSRANKQKLREKDDNLALKFFEIFRNLHFNLTTTLVNKNCSTVILKKLPKKLGDPDKFLIPWDFSELDECLALADLGASINLMPLSIWRKIFMPELTPMRMILELADRSTTRPAGIAKDVFVKVGKFHFLTNFVVVDYVVDPRELLKNDPSSSPLHLKELNMEEIKIVKSSIDEPPELELKELPLWVSPAHCVPKKGGMIVVENEDNELIPTRHVPNVHDGHFPRYDRGNNKAITFNLDQTSRYSANYDVELINRIDVIDIACEEYSQEVLGFSVSGNPTPFMEPIVSISSLTLTPFRDSDFLLEETDAFLAIEDEPISWEIDDSYYDSKGDILLLGEFLNDDPSSPHLPPQELEEKSHFRVKEGIVLGHKISKNGTEVDKAKVDVIAKLPDST
nr:reverse transcriptase domain-containing protein [Tanacetum cinerariifolium]